MAPTMVQIDILIWSLQVTIFIVMTVCVATVLYQSVLIMCLTLVCVYDLGDFLLDKHTFFTLENIMFCSPRKCPSSNYYFQVKIKFVCLDYL